MIEEIEEQAASDFEPSFESPSVGEIFAETLSCGASMAS